MTNHDKPQCSACRLYSNDSNDVLAMCQVSAQPAELGVELAVRLLKEVAVR